LTGTTGWTGWTGMTGSTGPTGQIGPKGPQQGPPATVFSPLIMLGSYGQRLTTVHLLQQRMGIHG
jgi:hypothetical protein